MLYVWLLILTSMTGTAVSGVVGRSGGDRGGGPSGLEDPELALLLVQESRSSDGGSVNGGGLLVRRITPKSVFVAPRFCPDGERLDSNGKCVKVIRVNPAAQWDFLLQKLNSKYAAPVPSATSAPDKGPLRIPIPLVEAPSKEETPTTTTTTEEPTTVSTLPPQEETTVTTRQPTIVTTTLPPETTTDLPPSTTPPPTGCAEEGGSGEVEVRQVRDQSPVTQERPCRPHRPQENTRQPPQDTDRTLVVFREEEEESVGLRRVVQEDEHRVVHRGPPSSGYVRWPDEDWRRQPYWWPTSYQRIRHYRWNHHGKRR